VTWLKKLFKAIESFAEHAYKKPIWIIMTVICGSCFTFIASYQSSLPEERARLEKVINERKVDVEDSERYNSLYKDVVSDRESVRLVWGQFNSIIEGIKTSGRLTDHERQIEENYHAAIETRRRVEIVIAKIKGTNFRAPYLNEDIRATEHFLISVASVLKLVEDFWAPYLTGEGGNFVHSIIQSNSRVESINKELTTALTQMNGQTLQLQSAARLKKLELKITYEQAERHRIKGFLQIPAVVFLVGYIVFISRGVRKFFKEPSLVILRQNRVISTPKKRRRKR
jgi:hypothetical protein